jgi:hypothetical protein
MGIEPHYASCKDRVAKLVRRICALPNRAWPCRLASAPLRRRSAASPGGASGSRMPRHRIAGRIAIYEIASPRDARADPVARAPRWEGRASGSHDDAARGGLARARGLTPRSRSGPRDAQRPATRREQPSDDRYFTSRAWNFVSAGKLRRLGSGLLTS